MNNTMNGGKAPAIVDQKKTLLMQKKKLPAYMQSLNQQEKAENFKIIDSMNKKIGYKKNPRYRVNKAPITFEKVKRYID